MHFQKSHKNLYAYGSTTPFTVGGTFAAEVNAAGKHVTTEFTVIEEKGEPLLGTKTAVELGVLKLQVPIYLKQFVNNVTDHIARQSSVSWYWRAERLSVKATYRSTNSTSCTAGEDCIQLERKD